MFKTSSFPWSQYDKLCKTILLIIRLIGSTCLTCLRNPIVLSLINDWIDQNIPISEAYVVYYRGMQAWLNNKGFHSCFTEVY